MLLLRACDNGCGPAVAAFLLKAGADVRSARPHGATCLHMTSSAAVTRLLIAAGADVNAVTPMPSRVAPLHTVLLSCPRSSRECLAKLHVLVASGADVNMRDAAGCTPLRIVLGARRTTLGVDSKENTTAAMVRRLLRAGADPTLPGHDGRTPLDAWVDRLKAFLETASALPQGSAGAARAADCLRAAPAITRVAMRGAAWWRRRHPLLVLLQRGRRFGGSGGSVGTAATAAALATEAPASP